MLPLSVLLALAAIAPAQPDFAAVTSDTAIAPISHSRREAVNMPYMPGTARTAPPRTVQFGNHISVQVNVDAAGNNILGDAANEPSIAVDPTNPDRMAIGWRQFDTIQSNFRQAGYAYSTDAGRHWTFPGVLELGRFRSDPVLAADSNGVFYYCSLLPNAGFESELFQSTDHGAHWQNLGPCSGGDKPWIEVDRTNEIGRGNIYTCSSRPYFVRSTDGGQTWSSQSFSSSVFPAAGNIAVNAEGSVFVSGFTQWPNEALGVGASVDAKDSTVVPTFRFANTPLNGTLSQFVDGPNPEGLLGTAWIDCDRSNSSCRGNCYVVASILQSYNSGTDVMFTGSIDGGLTWGPGARLNTDLPDDRVFHWFGTMSVAPNGRIDVIWNDTRQSPDNYFISELYYSGSYDGGATWTPNEQLSPAWDSSVGWPQQNRSEERRVGKECRSR